MSGSSSDESDSDHSIEDTQTARALSPADTTDSAAADQLMRVQPPSTESTAESSAAISSSSIAASSSRSLPVSTHRKQKKNTREKRRRSELNTKFDILRDLLDMNQTKSKAEKTAVLSQAITVIRRWKSSGNSEILVARQMASSTPQAAANTITASASSTATTAVLLAGNLQRYAQSAPIQFTPSSAQQQPLSAPPFNPQRPTTHLMQIDGGQTQTQMLQQYNHNVQPQSQFVPIRQSAVSAFQTPMSAQQNAVHLTQRLPLTSSQSPASLDAGASVPITSPLHQAKAADMSSVSTLTSADKQSPLPIAQPTTSPLVYGLQSPTAPQQPLFYPQYTLPRAPSQLHSLSQPAMSTQQQHSQHSPMFVSYAHHHQLPVPMHYQMHPMGSGQQQSAYSHAPVISYQAPLYAGGQSQTVGITAQPQSAPTNANPSATSAVTSSSSSPMPL